MDAQELIMDVMLELLVTVEQTMAWDSVIVHNKVERGVKYIQEVVLPLENPYLYNHYTGEAKCSNHYEEHL